MKWSVVGLICPKTTSSGSSSCAGNFGRRGATLPDDLPMLDVLLARAERLSPAARHVAAALATAGRPVDASVLAEHLSSIGDDVVAAGLREALDHHLLVRQGDVVEFQFMQKNHTATQSTFAEPCKAMAGGMDSGFMPNPDGKAGVTWNMTVSTTDPLCKPTLSTTAYQKQT